MVAPVNSCHTMMTWPGMNLRTVWQLQYMYMCRVVTCMWDGVLCYIHVLYV